MPADLLLSGVVPLTAAERRDLLCLARAAIRGIFDPQLPSAPIALTLPLLEPTAAFVSLHCEGRLRGCVGTVTPDRPLHEAVGHMARAAACDDPRFPSLAPAEISTLDIEISRLSRMVSAQPEDVRPGVHGVCLARGEQRAVFLPQVATTHHWDRDMLLDELCQKALLPPHAWRQSDCNLLVFVAEVFGDCAGRER